MSDETGQPMKVFLNEIRDIEKKIELGSKTSWALDAIADCDEKEETPPLHPTARTRPLDGFLSLQRVDELYVVTGKFETAVQLICSRCAKEFAYECAPDFTVMYSRNPETENLHFDPTKLTTGGDIW